MAYSVIGTAGNNTLNQSGDVGPGEIFGLGGSDEIRSGTGAVTVDGGSGDDTVILQFGNTGQVTGGTENDSIYGLSIGSMVLYGNEGADTIWSANATAPQTVLGGNDSADGSDSIYTGVGADLVFGNGGNDTIRTTGGADTMIGGVGNDSFYDNGTTSSQLAWGNEGNDIFNIYGGSDTIFAGQGNDSVWATGGTGLYYMGENNDTFYGAGNASGVTVAGGNDSGDGADSIVTGTGADFVLGNGGNDTIVADDGANTLVGGFGADTIRGGVNADLIWGNESNDTVYSGSNGPDTVWAGQGEDSVYASFGRDLVYGNEGNDTLRGSNGIDTVSGGAGADVFRYTGSDDDGDNANAGGPIEQITDVNFDEDRFQVFSAISFAAATSAGAAINLEDAADAAVGAAYALAGGGAQRVAATFDFNGRSYLAIDQGGAFGAFTDVGFDLLLDITGATGTIGAADFLT